MITKNSLLFAAVLFTSLSVHAQDTRANDTGGYVGGEIATNSVTEKVSARVNGSGYETISQKASATAFSVYGGYNFTNWFGLESAFAVTKLSKGTSDAVSIASFSLTPKFTVRTSDTLSIYAKAGIAVTALCDDNNNNYNNNDCRSGTAGTAGIGLQFDLSQHAKLRFGYDVTKGSLSHKEKYSSYSYDSFDLTQNRVSVSMHYQF